MTGDPEALDPGVPFVDTAVQGMEYAFVARAFARLPEHWQTVLWHTEVEGENPADLAPMMGLTPNGVAAMAYRARERLRQHYLQEHIAADPGDECRWSIERLGAHVRGGLSRRDGRRVEGHLDECRRCHLLFVELAEVNAGMREVLAGALLAGSAGAYLATGGSGAGCGSRAVRAAGAAPLGAGRGRRCRGGRRRGGARAAPRRPARAGGRATCLLHSRRTAAARPHGAAPGRAADRTASTTAATVPAGRHPLRSRRRLTPGAVSMEARLEPVGTLVRGRPGVLALTVVHPGQTGGTGGGLCRTRPAGHGPAHRRS